MSENDKTTSAVETINVNDVVRVIVGKETKKGYVIGMTESYTKKYRIFLRDTCKIVAVEEHDLLGKVIWDGKNT
jgi:hypothetical protein